jgi:hypothetical protein
MNQVQDQVKVFGLAFGRGIDSVQQAQERRHQIDESSRTMLTIVASPFSSLGLE